MCSRNNLDTSRARAPRHQLKVVSELSLSARQKRSVSHFVMTESGKRIQNRSTRGLSRKQIASFHSTVENANLTEIRGKKVFREIRNPIGKHKELDVRALFNKRYETRTNGCQPRHACKPYNLLFYMIGLLGRALWVRVMELIFVVRISHRSETHKQVGKHTQLDDDDVFFF